MSTSQLPPDAPTATRPPRQADAALNAAATVHSGGGPPPTVLYTPFRDWFGRRPSRPIAVAATALIAIQTLYRGWLCYRGWFVGDDFAFIGRAQTLSLWSHDYLIKDYNGHVMPGAFLVVRLMTALWPMNFIPVATLDIAIETVTAIVIYRLLRALFGVRPAILVPLAIYLFSPVTLPAFLWLAAALNQLPQQLAMATALLLHVGYLRTGRTRRGVLGAVAVTAGLLFSEKTLLIVPFIAALTVLFFTEGPPGRRLRTAWRRHWRVWSAYLVIAVLYAAYYFVAVPTPTRAGATSGSVINLATNMVGHALLPGLLGGPWRWMPIASNGAVADPPHLAVWLVILVTIAIIATSVALHHRAAFGWLLAGGYLVLNIALLANSRATVVGPLIGSEYRYSTDICLVAIVGGALAFLPVAGDFAVAVPQVLIPRASVQARLRQAKSGDIAAATPPSSSRGIAAILACLFAVGCLSSSMGFDRVWRPNAARSYLATVKHDLAAAGHSLTLADGAVPDNVVWPLVFPYNLTHIMFEQMRPLPIFLTPGNSAPALFMPDTSGAIRLVGVVGFSNKTGPETPCGWRVRSEPLSIPLQATTLAWTWTIRIDYIATGNTSTVITAGSVDTIVKIHPGLNSLYLRGEGRIDSIHFSGLRNGVSLCTNDVNVGSPVPVPGTHP